MGKYRHVFTILNVVVTASTKWQYASLVLELEK